MSEKKSNIAHILEYYFHNYSFSYVLKYVHYISRNIIIEIMPEVKLGPEVQPRDTKDRLVLFIRHLTLMGLFNKDHIFVLTKSILNS